MTLSHSLFTLIHSSFEWMEWPIKSSMCVCAAIPFILMKFLFRKTTVYISVVVIVVPVQVQSHKYKKTKTGATFEAWAQDSIWRPFISDEYILCFYYYYKCHCTRWAQKTVEGRERGDRLHKAGSGQSLNQSKANLHRNNCRGNALPRERHTNSTNPISSTSSSGNLIGALKSQLAGRRTEDVEEEEGGGECGSGLAWKEKWHNKRRTGKRFTLLTFLAVL